MQTSHRFSETVGHYSWALVVRISASPPLLSIFVHSFRFAVAMAATRVPGSYITLHCTESGCYWEVTFHCTALHCTGKLHVYSWAEKKLSDIVILAIYTLLHEPLNTSISIMQRFLSTSKTSMVSKIADTKERLRLGVSLWK